MDRATPTLTTADPLCSCHSLLLPMGSCLLCAQPFPCILCGLAPPRGRLQYHAEAFCRLWDG
jgi:hypothetical protein